MDALATYAGLVGVALALIGYGLVSTKRIHSNQPIYQWLNIGGSAGILLSLITQWNLPSFLANAAWLTIGLVSVTRIYCRRSSRWK